MGGAAGTARLAVAEWTTSRSGGRVEAEDDDGPRWASRWLVSGHARVECHSVGPRPSPGRRIFQGRRFRLLYAHTPSSASNHAHAHSTASSVRCLAVSTMFAQGQVQAQRLCFRCITIIFFQTTDAEPAWQRLTLPARCRMSLPGCIADLPLCTNDMHAALRQSRQGLGHRRLELADREGSLDCLACMAWVTTMSGHWAIGHAAPGGRARGKAIWYLFCCPPSVRECACGTCPAHEWTGQKPQ